jgi:hypothetical protein
MRIESSGLVRIQNINNSITFDRYFQTRNALIIGYSGTNEAKLYLHRDDVTISSGNVLGELNFSGADGGSLVGANVQGIAAGSWGSTSCPSDLVFSTASSGSTSTSERMRIDSSGNVLIGTTSTLNGNTDGLHVDALGSTHAMCVQSGGNGYGIVLNNSAGTEVGSIVMNASTTTYNTSSDYRLKENVVDMTGALDRVDQLEPKRFNFISNAETTVDGFSDYGRKRRR